ncbi:AAA family ATPase [Azospirillum tabaci]|uniref:AAA family ATPase n=1 Tax=Azospirillum tabaci TaxID=2752310 RepID=UPI001660313C|nr:AAA family ATPase [Azospirillum tabaci]
MKIISLEAENLKRIKVVQITPTGPLVQITGKNAAGKSTVLDAIWWALDGGKNIQSRPIRDGETEARVRLDLGEIIVTRKWKRREAGDVTTSITVEAANGARFPSPQRMLDDLLGSLTFDPLAFSRMDPKKQLEQLRGLVKLDVDVDALDAANRADFEKRTDANRRAKTLRTQAAAIAVPDDLPEQPVDVAALMDRMTKAADHNASIERRRANRERVGDELSELSAEAQEIESSISPALSAIRSKATTERTRLRDEIARLQLQIEQLDLDEAADLDATEKRLRDQVAEKRGQANERADKLANAEPLPDPEDVAILRGEIDSANAINDGIKLRDRRIALEKEAAAAESESKALTDYMADREREKAEAIAAAKMPIPGLSFGDSMVLFNGIPFDQASSAEQLRVSVAIAMATNPKLRVLRIKDGSLLDEDGLQMLSEMADASDYQVWVERVDSSGKVGVVMEDGTVATVPSGSAPAGDLFAAQ